MPCDALGVVNMTDPGPTLVVLPSQKISPLPLSTIMTSSSACVCGAWGVWPGLSTNLPVTNWVLAGVSPAT